MQATPYLYRCPGRNWFLYVITSYSIHYTKLYDGSAVEYISNTRPIPSNKHDIVVATAIAGELMGNQLIYLESGSGSSKTISPELIREVKRNISIPLLVGGGIRYAVQVQEIIAAGADIVVVGNAIERDSKSLEILAKAVHN